MSVWITFLQANTEKVDKLFDSINGGSFQRDKTNRFLELKKELEKYPAQTSEEIYNPALNTPENKALIEQRMNEREQIKKELESLSILLRTIRDLIEYRDDEMEFKNSVSVLALEIVKATGKSFSENLDDIEPYTDLIFKNSGLPKQTYENLGEIPFEVWQEIFKSLNKDVLSRIKEELENSKKWFEGAFGVFVAVIKNIKEILQDCDQEKNIFIVQLENEETNNKYLLDLEQKIISSFEDKPFTDVSIENIPMFF